MNTVVAGLAILLPAALPDFRPPSVPLVAHDPYFSVWSPADRLTDADTVHWTGRRHALTSLVRSDGRTLRLMGAEPAGVPALPQTGLDVTPTRTTYRFEGEGIRVELRFLTPALPEDLDVLARPLTYVTWSVAATDGAAHDVAVYFSAAAELCVDDLKQEVCWARADRGGLTVLKAGSKEQPVLQKKGDDRRIDWGWLYLAGEGAAAEIGARAACAKAFADTGGLAGREDPRQPRAADDETPVLALAFALGKVGAAPVRRTAMLAYDDEHAILYFGEKLRAWWRRGGMDAGGLLDAAFREFGVIEKRCVAFDGELMADVRAAGGEAFGRICALAYRQCIAACKLAADPAGQPVLFPKENFSNGCIATVDVFYPMLPQFLLLSPTLARAAVAPVLAYAASERWPYAYAPHDLGQYPHATGQRYGMGKDKGDGARMPVEESGNMILCAAGIAKIEGHTKFADPWWPQLAQWAKYLADTGYDPENQLCTDDFAGHLAHNVNLSAKAICALGAFAMMSEMRGDEGAASANRKTAGEFAKKWMAAADDGDHFRLAFDKPGTWSQKYNLVWDRLLGLKLFPAAVVRKEMDYYRRMQNRFGLPLDSRSDYTKLDWIVWTAALTGERADLDALIAPVQAFLQETPDRVPMTDWYFTSEPKKRGFQARPVVGGVFIPLLGDIALWRKWASRDRNTSGPWAPIPPAPKLTVAVASGQTWRFTTETPPAGWEKPGFDDGAWKEGAAGFGAPGTPGIEVKTAWKTKDIWIRRKFLVPPGGIRNPMLHLYHDEDAEVFINGIPAAKAAGYVAEYVATDMAPAAAAALRPGAEATLAIHCRQTKGGQGVDCGILRAE